MNHEYELIRHIESTSIKLFFVSIIHRLYHWHSDIEILLVVEGSVTLETANHKYLLLKNDFFILNANEVHSLTRTDESNTLLALQFDPKFCRSYFPQLQRIIFLVQHITLENYPEFRNTLREFLYQIVSEYYEKSNIYPLNLMSTLQLMICSLIKHLDYENSTVKAISNQKKNLARLNHIILYIKENYRNKISLRDIAENENLDMYYLSHFIKKHLGISFQEYLNKVRFEKALELLLFTDLNKLEICMESGFSDYRYLNKMFLNEFGCTPSEYRSKHQLAGIHLNDFSYDSQNEVIYGDIALAKLIKSLEICGQEQY